MRASGKGAWWNQYSNRAVPDCIARAKDSDIQFVIVKADYPSVVDQFLEAGIRVGIENYTKPDNPEREGEDLARGIARGGDFAVINAEKEWESKGTGPMQRLIGAFRNRQPDTELYASTDTRGGRIGLPYQQVLGEYISGWMPMIYPLAFRSYRPAGYIATAFADCLDRGQDFQGKPVLPTLQTYDRIGAEAVKEMIAEVKRRGLQGYQAYTIGHATDSEWQVITRDDSSVPYTPPTPDDRWEVPWLEEKIIGLDGKLKFFSVIESGLTTRTLSLTRKEWIHLSSLGLIVNTHKHQITLH